MIPITKPSITALEKKYVNNALESGFVGSGEYIKKFEQAWAKYNGYSHGIACSSGTAALFLALKALGIGPGDEVIVPDFTMISCAWAVTWTGATPVFVDCRDDLNMDPDKLELAFTVRTKALMAVAIYGRPVDQRVFNIAEEKRIPVIEDLAEGHGIKPRGQLVCYSFYGNKIITTGEGGMILANNTHLADEMDKLRNLYFDKDRSMIHEQMGYNYRMSNLQAAFGLAQVQRFNTLITKRKQVMRWYSEFLPRRYAMPKRAVGWVYDVPSVDPVALKKHLWDNGVDSRYWFKPMTSQPMYRQWKHSSPTAHSLKGLYLPLYPDLTKVEVKKICQLLP